MLLVILTINFQVLAEDVIINEIMASNQNTIQDNDSDFDDWIELKNIGNEPVNLSGYYLSDKEDRLTRWQFDSDKDYILQPGDNLLLWADEELDEGKLHISFKLNSNGEVITLTKPDGNEIMDQIKYPKMMTDVSYGRDNKNIAKLKYFVFPTPKRNNNTLGLSSYYWVEKVKFLLDNIITTFFFIIALIIILILLISYYKINKKLETSKNKYKKLFKESPIGLIKCDIKGNVLDLNKEMVKLIGAPDKETVKRYNMNEVEIIRDIWNKNFLTLDNKKDFSGEVEITTSGGKKVFLKYKVAMVSLYNNASDNNVSEYIFAVSDISREKEIEKGLKYLSFHDELTGLYNRRYFENELERLNQSRKLPISIIICDIDNLKYINDNFGHKMGDEYIVKAAEIIGDSFRDEDIVARIGGDEFAAILPDTNSEIAFEISEGIKKKCKEYKNYKNFEISSGYATKEENIDLEEIFIKADKMMYEQKKSK